MNAKDLRQRYQLKTRQALDSRLKTLGLNLPKDHRGHRFATPAQIEQLDDLHRWLSQGGTMQNYSPAPAQLSVISVADAAQEITTIDTEAIETLAPPLSQTTEIEAVAVETAELDTALEAEPLDTTDLEVADVETTELDAQDVPPPPPKREGHVLLPVLSRLLQTLQAPPQHHSPLYVWEQLEMACEKGWLLSSSQIRELTGMQPHGDLCEYGSFSFQRHGTIGREAGWEVWKNSY